VNYSRISDMLGTDADHLLNYTCVGIPRSRLALPGPDFSERVWPWQGRVGEEASAGRCGPVGVALQGAKAS